MNDFINLLKYWRWCESKAHMLIQIHSHKNRSELDCPKILHSDKVILNKRIENAQKPSTQSS